jgi:CHAT domain-containing protein/lipopolysaccharide biosynthesis regulator YciM
MKKQNLVACLASLFILLSWSYSPASPDVEIQLDEIRAKLDQNDFAAADSLLAPLLSSVVIMDPGEHMRALRYACESQASNGRGDDLEDSLHKVENLFQKTGAVPGRDYGMTRFWAGYYLHRYLGENNEALALFRECRQIMEEVAGPEDTNTLRAIAAECGMLQMLSRYPEAGDCYASLLPRMEKVHGRESEQVAKRLHNIAEMRLVQDRWHEVEKLEEEALDILNRVVGPDDILKLRSMLCLGQAYQNQARFKEAERILDEAREFAARVKGVDLDQKASTFNVLADNFEFTHRYSEAIQNYNRAIEVLEGAEELNKRMVAQYLTNLGQCYVHLEELDKALEIFEKSRLLWLELSEEDREAEEFARVLSKMAAVFNRMGEPERAGINFQHAEHIYEQLANKGAVELHQKLPQEFMVAHARFLISQNKPREASEVVQQALAALNKNGDVSQLELRWPLVLLGQIELELGRPQEAMAALEQAQNIITRYLGEDHIELAGCLELKAKVLLLEENQYARDQAFTMALKAARIRREFREDVIGTLPHAEALSYATRPIPGLQAACQLALEKAGDNRVARVWDEILRGRGLFFDQMIFSQMLTVEINKAAGDTLGNLYKSVNNELAILATRGGDLPGNKENSDRPITAARLADLRQQQTDLEVRIGDRNARFRQKIDRKYKGLSEVRLGLPARTALVAFTQVHFPDQPEPAYLAFVQAEQKLKPEAFQIGSVAEIDSLVTRWRRALTEAQFRESPLVGDDSEYSRQANRAGERLRARIWDPWQKAVADCEMIFVVPQGMLSFVNPGALPDRDGEYLVEKETRIHFLAAELDLTNEQHGRMGGGMLAVGNPDYSLESPEEAGMAVEYPSLPYTGHEVDRLAEIYGTRDRFVPLKGQEATEGRVKQEAPGKGILHFATHGFFHGGKGLSDVWNPLFLSGLAFCGANVRDPSHLEEEDGLLTAMEISLLDLSACDWAVLSACDSGLGVIRGPEGVLGLPRAFLQAGAGTVIMSLWSLDDEETLPWIEELYRARFEEGLGTAEAVRAASIRRLQAARKDNLRTLPLSWGGFVAVGDWGR